MIIDNFQIEDHKLIHYLGRDNVVEIPNSITSLGEWVFWQSIATSITIPNSVTTINIIAFDHCTNLENINVVEDNANYTSIDGVLYSKDKKTLIRCPEGKETIKILDSVTTISCRAFSGCRKLKDIKIPNNVTKIEYGAFYGCKALTDIKIPNSITSIEDRTFYECEALRNIEIPNSVTKIGICAFEGCSALTSIEIPNSITSIENYAFERCSALEKVEFASIESLCSISFGAYYSNPLGYAHHLYINGQEITNLVIPDSVTSIEEWTFHGCTELTSIIIPNSVTTIKDMAFYGCAGLTNITIPDSVMSIGTNAFSDCKRLTSIIIGNNVTSIGASAFCGCFALTSIKIPNSVTKIGDQAFGGCVALTNIEIPDSVIYRIFKNISRIWNNIFLGCRIKHKSIKNRVVAYKGFKSDMTCRDFQYEEGKTYTCDEAKLCRCGFHACLNPLDCFNYYYGKDSIYHEVILEDICNETGDDSKICGKKITIGRKLTIKELFDIFNNLNKD